MVSLDHMSFSAIFEGFLTAHLADLALVTPCGLNDIQIKGGGTLGPLELDRDLLRLRVGWPSTP